jgi:hypothetical protein
MVVDQINQTWPDPETQQLCEAMDQATIARPRRASYFKKLIFVMLHKENFEIKHICRLSHELVENYPGNKKMAQDVAMEDVQAIGETQASKIVEIVGQRNEKTDEGLQKAVNSLKSPAATYNISMTGANNDGFQAAVVNGGNYNWGSKK